MLMIRYLNLISVHDQSWTYLAPNLINDGKSANVAASSV